MSKLKDEVAAVVEKALENSMSYERFTALMEQLVKENAATGPEQSEALANYTALNQKRMKRLDKTTKVPEDIAAKIADITKHSTWLVLTESWCGDAAQTMPVLKKLAALNDRISYRVALRDENVELMQHFLTNGGMSIPKLIVLDDVTGEVVGDWGPRPSKATALAAAYKEEHGSLTAAFKQELQVWYNKDKGQNTITDIMTLLALE